MHQDFDDELFLAPEATVSLHFDSGSEDQNEAWDIDHSDMLALGEYGAWVGHAARTDRFSDGLVPSDNGNDDRPMTLREAVRLVMELP